MNEVSLTNGKMDEREFRVFIENDSSSDGTVAFTRAHAAEQEMIREGSTLKTPQTAETGKRAVLLDLARTSSPLLRGWSITPLDDRLLVKYASFREGYVCETCNGTGHTDQICPTCKSLKTFIRKEGWKPEACTNCVIVGSETNVPMACGFEPCLVCKGSGLANGVLAVPDASKQDHSYGDIVSIGADIQDLRPGDRVLFSKMAGIHIHGDITCCLMRRGEVMGFMRKS